MEGLDKEEIDKLARKIRQRGSTRDKGPRDSDGVDFKERVPPGRRRRLKCRQKLTVAEKVEIVHKVLVGHEKQPEVAREFRVGPVTVN